MVRPGVDQGVSLKQKAHVLVVTIAFPGHFAPFVQILYHLADKYPGLTVTVMGNKDRIADLTKLQSKGDLKSLDLRLEEVFGPVPVYHQDPKTPVRASIVTANNYKECEYLRKKLVAQKDEPGGPTAIIADMFQYWSEELAGELGVPWYPYYSCSATYTLTVVEVPKFPPLVKAGVYPPTAPNASDILINAVPNVTLVPGRSFIRVGDLPEEVFGFTDFFAKVSKCTSRATAVLINTSEELESSAVIGLRTLLHTSRVLSIGPSLQHPGFGFIYTSRDSTSICLDWLDSQRPKSVLYIAFGSLVAVSKEMIVELAEGVEAAGVPFLWVLNPGSLNLSEILPPGFVERTNGRGLIETSWAPQSGILSHPSTGGFVTHCDWNSILESLCAGVPLIAWPILADQFVHARYIANVAKVGLALSYFKPKNKESFEGISRHEIEKATRLLMLGNEPGGPVRRNVEEMQKCLTASVAEGGSSYRNLHNFLDEIASTFRANEIGLRIQFGMSA